jgi:methylmalonyl-CoA mutase cobalamin-binding domain/chain
MAAQADPLEAIDVAAAAVKVVGEKFDCGEYFLPQVVLAADAMAAAMKIIEPNIPKDKVVAKKKVVIGTVKGDMHDIGKNIVGAMLRAGGFDVFDVGKDVPVESFINKAEEVKADVIGASALLTATMPFQEELVEELQRLKLREKYKVILGGGPVNANWAESVGADGYGVDAIEAVKVVSRLTGVSGE